jgi:transcription elongation factor Elf1
MNQLINCPYCGEGNSVDLDKDIFSSQCNNCRLYFALVDDDDCIVIQGIAICEGSDDER